MAGGKKLWKLPLKILGGVVSAALLAFLAASLILAKPQEEHRETAVSPPSQNASPAISIDSETDLVQLVSSFPAPVMCFMSGSGMTIVSATSADTAYSGGFGRVATLYWQTPEGEPLILQSIWPADALTLLEEGYHFMPYAGPTLFGNTSVRMENDASLRIHVTTGEGLYVLLLPRSLRDQVGSISRSLQLFTAGPQD